MKRKGFALADAVAAMVILGLAFGGLTQLAASFGRAASVAGARTDDTAERRRAARLMERSLALTGPFASAGAEGPRLTGSRTEIDIVDTRGTVRLSLVRSAGGESLAAQGTVVGLARLAREPGLAFRFRSDEITSDVWPPADRARRRLSAVEIVTPAGGETRVLVHQRLWVEQDPRCAFDAVSGDCLERPS